MQKHVYIPAKHIKLKIKILFLFFTRLHYDKEGVVIIDFTPDSEIQLSLFKNINPKHSPLMQVVDRINQSFVQKNQIGFARSKASLENETREVITEIYDKVG